MFLIIVAKTKNACRNPCKMYNCKQHSGVNKFIVALTYLHVLYQFQKVRQFLINQLTVCILQFNIWLKLVLQSFRMKTTKYISQC